MTLINGDRILGRLDEATRERLESFEAFAEIGSTNTHLMQATPPQPGRFRVAITDNQTAGRGRHGRTWVAPAGSGLCVSVAGTFEPVPGDLPALTLALGLGAIDALATLNVDGVQLKWPNDLIAEGSKLGGILTETRSHHGNGVTVVTGLGLNIDLGDPGAFAVKAGWDRAVIDVRHLCDKMPGGNAIAAALIDAICAAFIRFEQHGFAASVDRWHDIDWLRGRHVRVETPQRSVVGIAAGVANDGALLVDTGLATPTAVRSGTVLMAEASADRA